MPDMPKPPLSTAAISANRGRLRESNPLLRSFVVVGLIRSVGNWMILFRSSG
jgi:hypothetical protein